MNYLLSSVPMRKLAGKKNGKRWKQNRSENVGLRQKKHIEQEKKPLEYFERMLPSYDEYEREKYSKNYESESELLVQEFKSVTLQQDDIDVDIIGQGKRILIDNVWALYYNI